MAEYDITVRKGQDLTIRIPALDEAGAAFDVSDATIEAQIRDDLGGNLLANLVRINESDALITLVLPRAICATLPITTPENQHKWDIWVTKDDVRYPGPKGSVQVEDRATTPGDE